MKRRRIGSLTISGLPIVVYEADLSHDGDAGQCRDGAVYLDQSLRGAARQEILLHEVIHAVSNTYALGLREDQVHDLSLALFALGARIKLKERKK